MHCPSCKSSSLKPVKLESNLPAWKCLSCQGVLIDLLSYRAWNEMSGMSEARQMSVTEIADSKHALVRPKCSRVMLKFKISGQHSNAIDVCSHCDEAWLDEGEWQLLGALSLRDRLTAIFTEPWQRRIRMEKAEEAQRRRNREILGNEDLAEVERIAAWIEQHPRKSDLIRILLNPKY